MTQLVAVAEKNELKDDGMKAFRVDGREILLAKIGDRYYAADNRCPHLGGRLAEGKLGGTVITCPKHSSQFDLRDGRVVRWLKGSGLISAIGKALKAPKSLTMYNVKVEGDKVWVEI